jgi:hypothetical protein
MIDIENLSEAELAELKKKLDKKLETPICPCCGTRCGKYKKWEPLIGTLPVIGSKPWYSLERPRTIGARA